MGIPPIKQYSLPTGAELPDNQMSWELNPDRAVLLLHDMQRYFVDFFPQGQPPMCQVIDNVRAIRRAAVRSSVPVVYTAQPGAMTRKQRGLLYDLWGPGMDDEPEHKQIIDELAPDEHDTVLTKWRYSAFSRSHLAELLHQRGRDQLVICGVYAHVGVLMTAFDAFSHDIQPFLAADAVADFSLDQHRLALDYAARLCAMIVTTDRAITALEGLLVYQA